MIALYDQVDFRFHVNYHSFGELLLYSFGFQVNTPSADDPIYVALSGTDTKPAIDGFNPGVGADLYTTNGETTDFAHARQDTLAWTPELGDGPHDDGFVFPDKEGQVQSEFAKTLPFALDVAFSAADPDNPVSHLKIEVEPFYLNVAEIDPQKSHNPLSDFRFAYSYDGASQPVQILAKRDIDNDGNEDAVTAHWSINGGPTQTHTASEWHGGDRYGEPGDVYYHIVGATATGAEAGDNVRVWFTGGGATSDSFTYQVVTSSPKDVLVVAAEDYTGTSNVPAVCLRDGPNYLSYYTDALDANGVSFDVYDVDARGRIAPDSAGVLGHYDAVVWYTGNDLLTREPGQPGGTGAATLANNEMLELRAYLNEGGRLLYTGRSAGWQYANAFDYNPVSTPPCATTSTSRWTTGACCSRTTSCSTGSAPTCSSRTVAPTQRPASRSRSPEAPGPRSRDSTGRSTAVTAPTTTIRTPHVARPSRSSPRPACSSQTTSHSSPATRSRRGRPAWRGRSARTPAATTSTRTERTSPTSA